MTLINDEFTLTKCDINNTRFVDYEFTLPKCDINDMRFVGLKLCALGS
jgi:hypothetical protein